MEQNDEDDDDAVQERDEEQNEDFDDSKQEDSIEGPEHIDYERLSEFFFDLCLSWC